MAEPEAAPGAGRAPLVSWSRPSASMASISPVHSMPTLTEELSSPVEKNNNGHLSEVKFSLDRQDSCSVGSVSDDEEEEKTTRGGRYIPDGGWGWVIVFCSLVISLIADGISYSFGLLYHEFLVAFGESKSVTSWIGSLFLAVPLLSGPVCSALVDRFGCRVMTIVGATISCIGFALSAFAPNILTLYLTFGVVAGLGLGLCYVTAVVSIAYWFDKKLSLANGLGACGSGMGTFLYAPFISWLLPEYGWRGTVLILGGTLFNMAVCGALMREPEDGLGRNSSVARGGSSRASLSDTDFPGVDTLRKMLKTGTTPQYIMAGADGSMNKKPSLPNGDLPSPTFQSVINLPTYIQKNEKVPVEVLDSLKNKQEVYNVIVQNYPNLALSRSRSLSTEWGSRGCAASPALATTAPNSPLLTHPEDPRPLHRARHKHPHRHLSAPGYLRNIRVRRNSVMYRGAMLNIRKYRLKASSCPDIFRNSMTTLAKESTQSWRKEVADLCRDMADFSMFLDFHFLLVSAATMLVYTCYIVPYVYLPEFMMNQNYTTPDGTSQPYLEVDGSYALSVIGITTTVGMVGLGWMGDQSWVSVPKAFSGCLLGCGLCTIAMPLFMHNYYALMVASSGFGLFFSSVYSFTPPLIVEIIPLDRFTTAYGLSLLCQGVGNLVGPPIAGWIYDETGYWHMSFHLAGVGLVISCMLLAVVPFTTNRRVWPPRSRDLPIN